MTYRKPENADPINSFSNAYMQPVPCGAVWPEREIYRAGRIHKGMRKWTKGKKDTGRNLKTAAGLKTICHLYPVWTESGQMEQGR